MCRCSCRRWAFPVTGSRTGSTVTEARPGSDAVPLQWPDSVTLPLKLGLQ